MTFEINNKIFFFSIKRLNECLFSRRNGYRGVRLFNHSIFFTIKRKYGIY